MITRSVFCLILSLGSAVAFAHPSSLSCNLEADNGDYDRFQLNKNADGTYALTLAARFEHNFEKLEANEVLAGHLSCRFAGPKEQTLSCEELEKLPVDPKIKGPSGDMKHSLRITKTASLDGTVVNFSYRRSQQIWAAPIVLNATVMSGEDKGKKLKLENLTGSMSTQVGPDCFVY